MVSGGFVTSAFPMRAGMMTGERGFTLLEIVVVLMIAGILAVLIVPSYQRMANRARLNGATRELIADLMRTRMQCVAENRIFQFEFSGTSYRILRDNNRDGTIDSSEVMNVRDVARAYSGVTVTARQPMRFSTKGVVTVDTITVANGVGTKRLMMNMVGRIRVVEQ